MRLRILVCLAAACTSGSNESTDPPTSRQIQVSSALPSQEVVGVASGERHNCVLYVDGSVRCWGDSDLGQGGTLESASTDGKPESTRSRVKLGAKAIKVAAGRNHACALLDTGRVRCWGDNRYGQLGYGNTINVGNEITPAAAGDVPLDAVAEDIALGADHSCAVFSAGRVSCWGKNDRGQLGLGHNDQIGDNEFPGVGVSFGKDVKSIAHGWDHTCVLLTDGSVRCWGAADYGRLGYGTLEDIGDDEPASSAGPVNVGDTAKAITAARGHTCVITDDDRIRCWGEGVPVYGCQYHCDPLGDDEVPATEPSFTVGDAAPIAIVGYRAGTVVYTSDGMRHYWGQTGIAHNATYRERSMPYSNPALPAIAEDGHMSGCEVRHTKEVYCSNGYIGGNYNRVDTSDVVVDVEAGGDFTCARLANSRIRCFGRADRIGLGRPGNIGDDELPGHAGYVDVGHDVTKVVAGAAHTCVAYSDDSVRCFGDGSQLQNGTNETMGDNESPFAAPRFDLGSFESIQSDKWVTCVTKDGDAWCWGDTKPPCNGDCFYGYHAFSSDVPAEYFTFGQKVQRIAIGAHSCVIFRDEDLAGKVYCWGDNYQGQAGSGIQGYEPHPVYDGDGTLPPQECSGTCDQFGNCTFTCSYPVPDPIAGITGAAEIALSSKGTCVLTENGEVFCWGDKSTNGAGIDAHLGRSDSFDMSNYGPVSLGSTATQLAAGTEHVCVLLSNGTVRCWGSNAHGQLGVLGVDVLGDDETVDSIPALVFVSPVVKVSAGHRHTCVLLENHQVRCWGSNDAGQIGSGTGARIDDAMATLPISMWDADSDLVDDWFDHNYDDNTTCSDVDGDQCDDCAVVSRQAPADDGADFDGDGACDVGDADDDNDTVLDADDTDPFNANACSDADGDHCDDCTFGFPPQPASDGLDSNGDGICDLGDDADGDGVANGIDPQRYDQFVCGDADKDGCDDCSVGGTFNPGDDGFDQDADGICDRTDDSDNDGLTDETEILLRLPFGDADADDDGVIDGLEVFAGNDTDEDGVINALDCDSDGDGLKDGTEIGLTNSDINQGHSDTDISKGCAIVDANPQTRTNPLNRDSDGDGVPDGLEDRNQNGDIDPGETNPDAAGDFSPDTLDFEGDSLINMIEGGGDHDGDGKQNFEDEDADGDGIPDSIEAVDPAFPVKSDGKGNPDFLDVDSDDDGIWDKWEVGPDPMHPLDSDGSSIPDYRETDADDDGLADAVEGGVDFILNPGAEPIDFDGDGLYDFQDIDSDNDTIGDFHEATLTQLAGELPPRHNLDSDGDGIEDRIEAGDADLATPPVDSDGDGKPDIVDKDSDDDGVLDGVDNCRTVKNTDQANADGDVFGDACDSTPGSESTSKGSCQSGGGTACLLVLLPILLSIRRRQYCSAP